MGNKNLKPKYTPCILRAYSKPRPRLDSVKNRNIIAATTKVYFFVLLRFDLPFVYGNHVRKLFYVIPFIKFPVDAYIKGIYDPYITVRSRSSLAVNYLW